MAAAAAGTPVASKETPEPVKKADDKSGAETPSVAAAKEQVKEKEKAKDEVKEAVDVKAEPDAKTPLAEATAAATIVASTSSSGPRIVEPPTPPAEKQAKNDSSPIDKRPGLPQPPSPSTLGREEAEVGSPPMRSPPILITEPTKSSTSSATATAKEPLADTGKRDSSPNLADDKDDKDNEDQSPDDALLDAAWDGDLDAAVRALRHASPRVADDKGLTPLHLAAERDNLAVAMLLIDRGASVTSRSDGGRTPLHLAARSASAPTVEMLLERGKADANAPTARGRTPLHYAASKAADGDEERREVLRVLRDFGADPTIRDKEGETPRDVAEQRDHWDAAATLRRAEKKWEEDHKQNWLQRHRFMK
jgi:hypothetical protein